MFGWLFKPEVVEFLKIEGRSLTFKSKKHYKLRAQPTIQLEIPIHDEKQQFKLPVTITNVRELIKGQYIYTGTVPGAAQTVEQLRQLLEGLDPTAGNVVDADADFANARKAPRYPWSIRILSKDLIGFRGVTIDFNRLGIKLQTEGPVEAEKPIAMTLQVETSEVPELLCQGMVRWCREAGRRRFEVGVEFVDLDPEVRQQLEEFEKFLESRQTDNVTRRQMMDTTTYHADMLGPGVDAEAEELKKQTEPEQTDNIAEAVARADAAVQAPAAAERGDG